MDDLVEMLQIDQILRRRTKERIFGNPSLANKAAVEFMDCIQMKKTLSSYNKYRMGTPKILILDDPVPICDSTGEFGKQ